MLAPAISSSQRRTIASRRTVVEDAELAVNPSGASLTRAKLRTNGAARRRATSRTGEVPQPQLGLGPVEPVPDVVVWTWWSIGRITLLFERGGVAALVEVLDPLSSFSFDVLSEQHRYPFDQGIIWRSSTTLLLVQQQSGTLRK